VVSGGTVKTHVAHLLSKKETTCRAIRARRGGLETGKRRPDRLFDVRR
jgi:hypothetical protein